MYVCKYMCVCIWIYMYVNFFCFVLFSFIRGKGGRQLRPSLSGTVGGVTSPYTNTPFLGKKITWGKKMKKDYTSTRRTPRHSALRPRSRLNVFSPSPPAFPPIKRRGTNIPKLILGISHSISPMVRLFPHHASQHLLIRLTTFLPSPLASPLALVPRQTMGEGNTRGDSAKEFR